MRRLLLLIIGSLWLAACSQTPTIITSTKPGDSLPDQWRLKAKLGIRTTNDSGSVTLDWQQTNDAYIIQVQGPLGQGNATIKGRDSAIIIEQPGKEPLFSYNATQLIEDTFGWTIPLNNFQYWVRGLPHPTSPIDSVTYSDDGSLLSLQQAQWQLDYSRYQSVSGWQLPGRIRAIQQNSQLTLIIREWQLN